MIPLHYASYAIVGPVSHTRTSYLEDREPLALDISMQTPKKVTDRTFGSAELLLCGSAQMMELFSAEHRTSFHIKFYTDGIHSYSCFAL